MQPSRVSSEAPEVVPGQFLTTNSESLSNLSSSTYQASTHLSGQHSRAHSWLSSISDRKSKQPDGSSTLGPQIIQDDAAPYQPKVHSRRVFGLVTTIILVAIAFCLGGGIGGGVASAVLSGQKSKSTSTSSSSPAQATTIIDASGCPLINNSTYTSQTGATFLTLCSTSILSSDSGQIIDLSNSIQSSFDYCLDACAVATGCVGASWYMFDPQMPSRNMGCWLKNGTGEEVVASGGLSVVSGYLKSALPS